MFIRNVYRRLELSRWKCFVIHASRANWKHDDDDNAPNYQILNSINHHLAAYLRVQRRKQLQIMILLNQPSFIFLHSQTQRKNEREKNFVNPRLPLHNLIKNFFSASDEKKQTALT